MTDPTLPQAHKEAQVSITEQGHIEALKGVLTTNQGLQEENRLLRESNDRQATTIVELRNRIEEFRNSNTNLQETIDDLEKRNLELTTSTPQEVVTAFEDLSVSIDATIQAMREAKE